VDCPVSLFPGIRQRVNGAFKEVIGHLSEEDQRDFVGRIQAMLDANEPRFTVNH